MRRESLHAPRRYVIDVRSAYSNTDELRDARNEEDRWGVAQQHAETERYAVRGAHWRLLSKIVPEISINLDHTVQFAGHGEKQWKHEVQFFDMCAAGSGHGQQGCFDPRVRAGNDRHAHVAQAVDDLSFSRTPCHG